MLIIGEYGWLPEMFEASDLVFMGGSFAPIGGHNFLEAAARRKPIVVGPHFHNFAEPLASFLQRGAIVRVRNPEDLGRALKELIGDEKGRRNLGQAAFRFIQRGSGASRRYADLLRACLRGTQSQDKSAPRGPAEAGEVPHNF